MRSRVPGVVVALLAACRGSAPESSDAPAPALAPAPVAASAEPAANGPAAKPPAGKPPVAAAKPPAELARVRTASTSITASSLRRAVEALAADANAGRVTPSPGLDEAARWIAAEHDRIGLAAPTGAPAHLQRFDCSGKATGDSSNVIGVLPGSDPALAKQAVIVSAHYDHLGTRDVGSDAGLGLDDPADQVFNGANDDASGVAATLAIAEAFAALSPRPRRTVVFIAFCGEELGLRGSQYWVEHPLVPLTDTVAVVNLEMLGRPEPAHPHRVWVTGMPRSTMGERIGAAAHELDVEVVDGSVAGVMEGQLFEQSDNWPFAEREVVAHSLSTGLIDDHYHSVQDETDTLEYDAMALLVRGIALGTYRLAQDDDVPRWTDAKR
jgi:Peptidase family M28